MSTYLPEEIRNGLAAAQKRVARRGNRLRLEAGGDSFRVLRIEEDGLTLDVENAPYLRGLVDLYDGPRHLSRCLIVASAEGEHGEMRYEFKQATPVTDKAPVDYYLGEDAPVGLLTDQR